jgi:restriction system protein
MDIKEHGTFSDFCLVSPGTFGLNQQDTEQKRVKEQIRSSNVEVIQSYSFTECAIKVLEEYGLRNPMHYKEITRIALEKGWLVTEGKTPDSTMYAQILTEIKRYKGSGRSPRFVQHGSGMVGLGKWVAKGVVSEIELYNKQIRKELLSILHSMDPVDFEDLISRLLTEMGFEKVEVTKYCGDGGIDVRGVLVIGDVVRTKMAVQAKRWKNRVQSPMIQQLRGSLGAHEQGLIITTSDFSKGARDEAIQADKTPIALMNGEQLVTLLMEYSIGVRSTSHVLFDLDENSLLDRGAL